MAYFKLEFVERSKIGTLPDTISSLKASINYYSRVFSVNSLERALLCTLINFINMLTDELYVAAEVKHAHQKSARDAYERWKGYHPFEKTQSRFVDDFVDHLHPYVITPLAQMIRNELHTAQEELQALYVLDRKIYYAEQKFKLERIEELDHDAREACKALKKTLHDKFESDKLVEDTKHKLRNLQHNYDSMLDQLEERTKLLKKEEEKRKKLAKKLEDAQERLNKDESTRECVICMDAKITMAFTPCGHACTCKECAENFPLFGPCPICRKAVVHYLEIFMS